MCEEKKSNKEGEEGGEGILLIVEVLMGMTKR
jgi:hypothetical protein